MRDPLHVLKVMLLITPFIFVFTICQILEDRHADRAELYAERAARDYELVRLVQKTREMNAAALAIIRAELENPCTVRARLAQSEIEDSRFQNRKSAIQNSERLHRLTPLPGIPIRRDHPERARPGPSRYGARRQSD